MIDFFPHITSPSFKVYLCKFSGLFDRSFIWNFGKVGDEAHIYATQSDKIDEMALTYMAYMEPFKPTLDRWQRLG